ncbi:MAG: membrane protein insertion efficiency factor YidD [Bacilli bacterium]|nr:membrane protein insertion efficiency factor YidD [Bacilli bacterium]
MKKLFIKLIDLYQVMPMHTHSMCRFTPTCSEYMKQALIEYGTCRGLKLGIKRIIKCHPFGKYGYDPVPKKNSK